MIDKSIIEGLHNQIIEKVLAVCDTHLMLVATALELDAIKFTPWEYEWGVDIRGFKDGKTLLPYDDLDIDLCRQAEHIALVRLVLLDKNQEWSYTIFKEKNGN